MNSSKIIGGIIVAIVVVLVAIFAIGFLGKPGIPTGLPPAPSTTAYPPISVHPYLSTAQAEEFIGAVQTTSIKTYNTSAELSHSQLIFGVTNVSAAWSATYGGANNVSLAEMIVESPKAQLNFYSITANAQNHPNYTAGTYDGISYLEAPYNQTTKIAAFAGWKGNYDVIAIVGNDSTINMPNLISVVASDLP